MSSKSSKINLIINDEAVILTDSLGNTIHPILSNSTIYIPVTLMKQEFGKEIIYDSDINTVFIEDKSNMGNPKVRILSNPQYDQIYSIGEGLIKIRKNNKYGLLDLSGNRVVPMEYNDINYPSEGLIAVQKDKLYGYMDYKGKLVIPYLFESAWSFHGGMAFALKNNKSIHINKQGKTIFNSNTKYEGYALIDSETFLIKIGGKERIVNRQGKILKTLPYDGVSFSMDGSGVARVRVEDKFGYINIHGDELLPPIYDQAPGGYFHEGYKKGFIDRETQKIIKPIYDSISTFTDGLAAADINNKFGYINPKGETMIPFEFDHAETFNEKLAAVSVDKKHGYINTKGDIVVPIIYDQVEKFNNGYGIIKKGNMEGLVNTKGDLVIPLQERYRLERVHSEDMIVVYENEKWKYGAINTKGDLVVDTDCENFLFELTEGLYQIDQFMTVTETYKGDNKYGLVDRKGKVILPREYDSIELLFSKQKSPFYEEIFVVQKNGAEGLIAVRDF